MASPRYVDLALFGRRVRGVVGNVTGFPLTTLRHVLNVPARDDIRRLGHQISALTNEVRDLSAGMDDLRHPAPPNQTGRPTANRRPPPASVKRAPARRMGSDG